MPPDPTKGGAIAQPLLESGHRASLSTSPPCTTPMKTHPIEAAIGLFLIVCWAVAVLALAVIDLIRQAPAPAPAPAPIEAPAPAPAPSPIVPAAPIAAAPVLPVEQVLQLHAAGLSQRAIASRLCLTRSRVRKVLATATLCAS